MTSVHAPVSRDEVEVARQRLYTALEERDAARERYEAAIGTTVEMAAYVKLRAAAQAVSALDKWLRWAEGDFFVTPPADDALLESLLGH
jgi:hypothetical protein